MADMQQVPYLEPTCEPHWRPLPRACVLINILVRKGQTAAFVLGMLGFILQNFGSTRSRGWLRHCATNRKVAGSIPNGNFGIFHFSFRSHHGPGFDSAFIRNEQQECIRGVKAAGA